MSSKQIELKAVTRTIGKHNSRTLRKGKMIPAVGYGPKTEPFNFALTENDVIKYSGRKFDNEIFKLVSDDSKINGMLVLKKDISVHPVSRRPVHLDFLVPDMTQTVKVEVEINYSGTPKGLKEGGIFNILLRKIEVECLPVNIPESVTVDVSDLGLNEVMHVSNINLGSDNLKIVTALEDTIATVAAAKEEKAAAETTDADAGAEATKDEAKK